MPLYDKITQNNDTTHYIWDITEDFDSLFTQVYLSDLSKSKLNKFKSENRKREFLVTRILLNIAGFNDDELNYKPSGAPYLKDKYISISHTKKYVVVSISNNKIGVDIEQKREQIFKIAHKFVNHNEMVLLETEQLETLSVIWSCKEAMFKLCDKIGIDFRENLNILSIRDNKIEAEFFFNKESKNVSAIVYSFDNHYLVSTFFSR